VKFFPDQGHHNVRFIPLLLAAPVCLILSASAQKPAKAPPSKPAPDDVVIFNNGDQLTGKLERAEGGHVVFASKMAGELNIPLDNIKQLRAGEQFTLLRKDTVPTKNYEFEGSVVIQNKKVYVDESNGTHFIEATSDVAYLIPQKDFDQQMSRKAGFRTGWTGAVTGGATLVRSTTSATTLTAGLNLVRVAPTVAWMPPRNRTSLNIVETYGKNTSPGAIPQTTPPTPSVTTLSSIFHSDAERDEYFSPRFYALADLSFDHNYAQGLQLQQVYGGGIGWTPLKSPRQELDLKADLHYEKQAYITNPVNGAVVATVPSVDLVGSTIFEGYHRNLPRKMVFTESANILPAFNNETAYSANVTAGLAIPVFKRLSASISTTDNFLNDPSPGYNRNSFQFVTGVTYAIH
jgi:hypothetical protein